VGLIITWSWVDTHKKQYFEQYVQPTSILDAVLQNTPTEKENTYKVDVEIVGIFNNNKLQPTLGKSILYIQKNEQVPRLQIGQHLLIKNNFSAIHMPQNPGTFDYKRYCNLNNIYTSAYLKNNDWQTTNRIKNSFTLYCNKLNASLRNTLHTYIQDTTASGVAEALLIGYRNNIDNDLWQAYSNAGIAHIIAISGMHMAMVYGSILWLLAEIPYFKKRKKTNTMIAIVSMWLFAFVIGMPASVIRAAVMLSTVGFAKVFMKSYLPVNNLAGAAFILLCIQPTWLFDVGFQLSFLAVLSLILFQRPINNALFFEATWKRSMWKLTSTTLAAQVLTLPVCIYYFHQFPLLFLLTNLIAIPLSTIILYAEIVLIAVQKIPIIASGLGIIITKLIGFLNFFILKINELSFVNWKNISINATEMMLLFICIIAISIAIKYKNSKALGISLLSIICLLGISIFSLVEVQKQTKLILYQSGKNGLVEIINKNNFTRISDSVDTKTDKYILQPAHLFYHVAKENTDVANIVSTSMGKAISIKNKRIIYLTDAQFSLPEKLQVDYLILSFTALKNIDRIKSNFLPKQIILDATIPLWKIDALKNELAELHLPIFSVNEKGAFVANL
jgi:competence protein ComEC